jgi:hypothetical protein
MFIDRDSRRTVASSLMREPTDSIITHRAFSFQISKWPFCSHKAVYKSCVINAYQNGTEFSALVRPVFSFKEKWALRGYAEEPIQVL